MQRVVFGALFAVVSSVVVVATTQAQTDHLKCYKVVDPLLLKGPAGKPPPPWLDLTGPQFGSEQCSIISGFRLFCVPVTKMVTQPLQRKFSPPGGPFQSFSPAPFAGEAVTEDKICYKIKCNDPLPAPPNPSVPVFDQFGQRTVTKLKPFLLCGPAGKGTRFTASLDSAQEIPPTGSPATGACTAILNETNSSLSISCTHNVVAPTAAHIHNAPAGSAGGIVFPLGSPVSPINATWSTITAADVADLLAGKLYVNVHSNNCGTCPGGEIRGQLGQP